MDAQRYKEREGQIAIAAYGISIPGMGLFNAWFYADGTLFDSERNRDLNSPRNWTNDAEQTAILQAFPAIAVEAKPISY